MQIKGRAEALGDAGAPARLREVVCEQGSSGGQWSRPSRRASDMGGLRLMIASVGGETGSTGSMACRAGAAAADLGWAGGATAARWPLPVDHHLSARPQRWARVETLSSKACRHGRACAGARATASVFLLPSPVRPPASRKSCCYTAATYTTSTPSRPSHLTQPNTLTLALVLRLLRASAPGNPYTNLRRDHHDPSRKPLPATRQRSPVLPSPDANSYPDLSAPGPTLSRARPPLLSLVEDFTSTTPLLP